MAFKQSYLKYKKLHFHVFRISPPLEDSDGNGRASCCQNSNRRTLSAAILRLKIDISKTRYRFFYVILRSFFLVIIEEFLFLCRCRLIYR